MTVGRERVAQARVPDDAFSGDVPLIAVSRGDFVGSLHRGTFAVANAEGHIVVRAGDPRQPVFLRSAAKPFQAMPAVLSGAVQRFGLTLQETAVLCASHSGEPRHMRAVFSVLEKAGLDESYLRCGTHPPIHEGTAADLIRQDISPSPVCNNCSGAHTAMLIACVANGWPLDSYSDEGHPLQVLIRQILATFASMREEDVELATDNCAVPTFRIPVECAAIAFARLVAGSHIASELREAASVLTTAMTSAPEMVAGEARFDSDLMAVAGGDIVSKGGAEAFQGIAVRAHGLGIALKITDGASRAVAPAAMAILEGLQALHEQGLESLSDYRTTDVHNPLGDLVGRVQPVFVLEPPQ